MTLVDHHDVSYIVNSASYKGDKGLVTTDALQEHFPTYYKWVRMYCSKEMQNFKRCIGNKLGFPKDGMELCRDSLWIFLSNGYYHREFA